MQVTVLIVTDVTQHQLNTGPLARYITVHDDPRWRRWNLLLNTYWINTGGTEWLSYGIGPPLDQLQ